MAQLQVQRTEVCVRRGTRQGGTLKAACPLSMLVADAPSEAKATEWLMVNVDARLDDQLSFIELALLPQAGAGINGQIAVL